VINVTPDTSLAETWAAVRELAREFLPRPSGTPTLTPGAEPTGTVESPEPGPVVEPPAEPAAEPG
jgi:hypothetical protein